MKTPLQQLADANIPDEDLLVSDIVNKYFLGDFNRKQARILLLKRLREIRKVSNAVSRILKILPKCPR